MDTMLASSLQSVISEFVVTNRNNYYRLAYSIGKDRDDALAIVQDSIRKALANQSSLHDASIVGPWFYRIVVNTAIDHVRKNDRCVCVVDDSLETLAGGVEDEPTHADLRKIIEQLSVRDRTVIALRYFEELKIEEVAQVMDENVNTIKTRIIALLKKMRLSLESMETNF